MESPSLTLFEVARFESREATSAESLGRKPKDLLEIVLLAAKRRQQSARRQFAAAASRLSERFQHFSAGLRPQLSADVASRLNSATSKLTLRVCFEVVPTRRKTTYVATGDGSAEQTDGLRLGRIAGGAMRKRVCSVESVRIHPEERSLHLVWRATGLAAA